MCIYVDIYNQKLLISVFHGKIKGYFNPLAGWPEKKLTGA